MELKVRFKPKGQMPKSDQSIQSIQRNLPMTSLLQVASSIYRIYYNHNAESVQKPLGVAIHRTNLRGKLIFSKKPVLLPEECFFPIEQFETL
jgi:hypothetical protein